MIGFAIGIGRYGLLLQQTGFHVLSLLGLYHLHSARDEKQILMGHSRPASGNRVLLRFRLRSSLRFIRDHARILPLVLAPSRRPAWPAFEFACGELRAGQGPPPTVVGSSSPPPIRSLSPPALRPPLSLQP